MVLSSKLKNKTGIVLTILMGLFLILSGIFTTIGSPQMTEIYNSLGLSSMQTTIGIGKIITSILFIIPATFMIGALLLTAFWGGAIVAHLSIGDQVIIQSILLIILYIIIALRRPNLFKRKLKDNSQ